MKNIKTGNTGTNKMTEPNLNPHEQAVEELLEWEAKGIRHTFDPELVVMADLKIHSKNKAQNNGT